MTYPTRNGTLEEWIEWDRNRPLFADWEFKSLEYEIQTEIYSSPHWRELEELVNITDRHSFLKRRSLSFEDLVEYIKTTDGMTYSKFLTFMWNNDDRPCYCGTLIPDCITAKNYGMIRAILPPPLTEPEFLFAANRPDLALYIRNNCGTKLKDHEWFEFSLCDMQIGWVITLVRSGIYPKFTEYNKYELYFTKKDIKKIKKGHRLCVGNIIPKNRWEVEHALYLTILEYKGALPLEYFWNNHEFCRDKILNRSDLKHVAEFLRSEGVDVPTTDMGFNIDWDDVENSVTTLKIPKAMYDLNIVTISDHTLL